MGGFRARDADRERYVEVIESAYVDGQLGEQDRELRVSRALTAETLDELHALTRDLQNQPAEVVVQTPAPHVVTPAPLPTPKPVRGSTGPDGAPKVLGLIAAGVFAVAVLGMMSRAGDDVPAFIEDHEYAAPWKPDTDGSSIGYQLSARDVRTFLRRYETRFGTDEAYEVRFHATRVNVQVPTSGGARSEDWTWDGEWRRVAQAQAAGGAADLVDLGDLDVDALFDNADVATSDLGVVDAELNRVDVAPTPDGRGLVTLQVRNGFAHTARLETTLDGSRLRDVPYDG